MIHSISEEYEILQSNTTHHHSFDIETTRGKKGSYMYIWQFDTYDGITHHTCVGRNWTGFRNLLRAFCNTHKNEVIFVHNLAFEYAHFVHYIEHLIEVKNGHKSIFALDSRRPIRIGLQGKNEFRCSYALTGMSLEMLAKSYGTATTKAPSIEYSELRNSQTELSDEEMDYNVRDVQILTEFSVIISKLYKNIPLTKTGIVRQELKRRFNEQPKEYRDCYKSMIDDCFPNESFYRFLMEWVYTGGYTHANAIYTSETLEGDLLGDGMASFDFKSSYPSCMFENFPYKFRYSIPSEYESDMKRVLANTNHLAFIGDFVFTNVRPKTNHSIFSSHKIIAHANAVFDNGRLRSASQIRLGLTELGFQTMLDFYDFDEVKVNKLLTSEKEPLPRFYLEYVAELFDKKETLSKDNPERFYSKRDINSMYGMCCTSLFQQILVYDGKNLIPSGLQDFNKAVKNQILLPYFGIYISEYARRNILTLIKEFGDDNVYTDTDSSKLINYHKHLPTINAYNERILARNRRIEAEYGFKLGNLGIFDFEEEITRFKTLGCKRYLADYDGATHVTIAGLPYGALEAYSAYVDEDIYDCFEDGLTIPSQLSNKRTTIYHDEPHSEWIEDAQGNVELMEQLSSVEIVDIPYSMSINTDYIALYKQMNELHKFARRG